MIEHQKGRYSKYIRPISIIIDLTVITLFSLYFFKDLQLKEAYYLLYQTTVWLLIAYIVKFYEIFRFTTPVEIISKLVKQAGLFLLVTISFFPFAKQDIFSGQAIAVFMTTSFTIIVLYKYLLFYYLKK